MRNYDKFNTPARKAAYNDITARENELAAVATRINDRIKERQQEFANTYYGKILELILQKPMTAKEISEAMHGDVTPQQVSAWLAQWTGTYCMHWDPVFHCDIDTKAIIERLGVRSSKGYMEIVCLKQYDNAVYVKLDNHGNPDFSKTCHRKTRIGSIWQARII